MTTNGNGAERSGPVDPELAQGRVATMNGQHTAAAEVRTQAAAEIACSLDNPDSCEMCSG